MVFLHPPGIGSGKSLAVFFFKVGLGSWLFTHKFGMYTVHCFTHPDLQAVTETTMRFVLG